MPKYQVRVDGHDYLVEVLDPNERPVKAMVDGHLLEVDVSAEPQAIRGERIAPAVIQQPSAAVVQPPTPQATPSGSASGPEVKAPLPGTIVAVSVAVGDSVQHGQELCVLEAMKMNNPIRAAQAGVISEIRISVGQQVQHGAVLMVMAEA